MTEENHKQLDEQLSQLTRWEGEKTELWREALDAQPTASFMSPKFLRWRIHPLAAVIALVGGLLLVATFTLPELSKARNKAGVTLKTSPNGFQYYEQPDAVPVAAESSFAGDWEDADLSLSRYEGIPVPALDLNSALNRGEGVGGMGMGSGGGGEIPSRGSRIGTRSVIAQIADGNELQPLDRQVIRKATIELRTDDVRATFLKAAQLISEANSEYTEASSLTGSGDKARANITLRVAVDRLSIVLNQLRELGRVHSEDMRGEDVTSRVVDLDARLRNEKRIEMELLELLEKRDDAPLKEIMDLRSRINEVRQSIEWLTAQKQRLSRLVSLATILVIIRAEDAPEEEPEPEPTLGQYFSDSVGTSWSGGLRFLSDTVAGLLRIVVGGIIWWVVIAVAIYSIMRSRRVDHLPTT